MDWPLANHTAEETQVLEWDGCGFVAWFCHLLTVSFHQVMSSLCFYIPWLLQRSPVKMVTIMSISSRAREKEATAQKTLVIWLIEVSVWLVLHSKEALCSAMGRPRSYVWRWALQVGTSSASVYLLLNSASPSLTFFIWKVGPQQQPPKEWLWWAKTKHHQPPLTDAHSVTSSVLSTLKQNFTLASQHL